MARIYEDAQLTMPQMIDHVMHRHHEITRTQAEAMVVAIDEFYGLDNDDDENTP